MNNKSITQIIMMTIILGAVLVTMIIKAIYSTIMYGREVFRK